MDNNKNLNLKEQNDLLNEEEEDMIESTGLKALNYDNLIERYFTRYYIDKGGDNEQYVFIHTNG